MSKKQRQDVKDMELEMTQRLPMKRYKEPTEPDNVVAFLASDASSTIGGTFIPIDGGVFRSLF
ncbi:SDR family oxidoreductase [Priestia megaterium]|uniref:SDR family oxidoreductase n=1 Tax=Priestia megaterium TaxID=1404 RepID=UPI00300A0A7F